jgi:hypothetical protein
MAESQGGPSTPPIIKFPDESVNKLLNYVIILNWWVWFVPDYAFGIVEGMQPGHFWLRATLNG